MQLPPPKLRGKKRTKSRKPFKTIGKYRAPSLPGGRTEQNSHVQRAV